MKREENRIEKSFQERYPVLFDIANSVAFGLVSDLFSQKLTNRSAPIDWTTIGKFTVFRCISTPIFLKWNAFLEKLFTSNSWNSSIKKLLVDRCLFAPLVYLSFFSYLAVVSNQPISNTLKTYFWPVYKTSLYVWPAVQLINFKFVPLKYRVFLGTIVGFFWSMYLSFVGSSSVKK